MRKLHIAAAALSLLASSALADGLFDIVTKGAIDRSVTVDIIDSTDGTPETAVVFNTAGIDLWYRREGAAITSITEVTLAALTTAHTDGGFLAIANGKYRLDLPDAAFATGANYVDFGGTVTGMIVIGGRVRLIDANLEDATRLGLAALPNAAAAASGGLFTRGTGAGQINQDANGRIDVNSVANGGVAITAAGGRQEVNVSHFGGTAGTFASGRAEVNATHLAGSSLGTCTGAIPTLGIIDCGTAVSVSATSLQLRAAANFDADGQIVGATCVITGGTTGVGQSRPVTAYTNLTDTATVPPWTTTPTGTITYACFGTAASSGALDAAGVRAAVGLATANLDTQLGGIQGDTDNIQTRTPAALVGGRMDASVGAYQTGLTPLQPTVSGRTLDVSTTGEAGLDWANVGAPTTALSLSGTTIATTQSIASVSGAVGSVTGNVGGNVIGFVGSVNTNGISAASLAADAGAELATAVWANVTRELTSGLNIVLAKGVGVTGFNDLSAAQVNTEADTALSDIFLDRLFAVDYNPAAEPGVPGAFINEATENDLGAIRYTTQMLENGPAGGAGGGSDWSVGEKEQIRHRIGIDGTASAPTATPSLASAASIAALNNLSAVQVRDSVSEDIGNVSRGCIEAVLLSFAAGDISTTGQTTTWRDPSNGEVRITSVVTSNGNRTATITCPTY